MPCRGCKKNMNEPEGSFKMRFIGKKGNKLMKGAPGNYVQGKVYPMPFRHSKFKFWELVEEIPLVSVPDASDEDSVFEDFVFVPPEEEIMESSSHDPDMEITTFTVAAGKPSGLLEGEGAIVESMKDYQERLANIDKMKVTPTANEEPLEEPVFVHSRDDLKQILDKAGVKYKSRARTETLQAMVEKLESEEES